MALLETIGRRLARHLAQPRAGATRVSTCLPSQLRATLRKGDVLLIEGDTRLSVAIQYLTQSTWSHAALYIADRLAPTGRELLEADVEAGVRTVPLEHYIARHTRICRPVGLRHEDIDMLVGYAVERLGHGYDIKNIIDLARYLLPMPPVPRRFRRRMLALGSGDPTRAICSSLIAQAFQSIGYPILPEVVLRESDDPACRDCYSEILHIRHHSLFAPRDFDVSPYFEIIKPTIARGFDHRRLRWAHEAPRAEAPTQV